MISTKLLMASALAAAALTPSTVVFAQGTAQQSAAVDPASLATAKQIVDISFPPAERSNRMHALMGTMTAQFKQGIDMEKVTDPGLHAILDDYFAAIPDALRPSVEAMMPAQMDAVAKAYTRMFSKKELDDILTFAKSPSGSTFLQRSMDVMSDPEVAAVNANYFKGVMQKSHEMAKGLEAKIKTYLEAHPEAAPKG